MANLSKIKREQLLSKIENLKKNLKDPNDIESLNTINEIQKEIQIKKYGLVWEEHSEKVDEMLVDNIPVFTEDKSKEIISDPSLPYNFLIEGDNLHALKLLEKTHKGKIDVIYIDPPYNMGNKIKKDFIYNDNYVDKNDGYMHSKWLSFMKKRLDVAINLLTQDGYICISIDDHELCNLKLLCDSIFGEINYVATIVVKSSETSGVKMSHIEKTFPKIKEYVLIYKKQNQLSLNPIYIEKEKWDEEYKSIITNISDESLTKISEISSNINRTEKDILFCNKLLENANYESLIQTYKIKKISTKQEKIMFNYANSHRIFQTCSVGSNTLLSNITKERNNVANTFFCYETPQKKLYLIKGDYDLTKKKPRVQVLFAKDYLMYNPCDLWVDIKTTGIDAEGGVTFKNGKKPLKLLKRLLSIVKNKNAIVLDFFAGSGTTAHAVMDLNQEDNGNRRFILCTNNENNICENITFPRIKTVITGKRIDNSEYSKGIKANLKYYKTDFIPKNSNQNQFVSSTTTINPISGTSEITLCDKLQNHIRELIQLETHHNIDDDYYKMVLDDTVLSNLIININKYPNLKEIYISSTILLDSNQKQILLSKNIKISEIPDYYFSKELKENGELW